MTGAVRHDLRQPAAWHRPDRVRLAETWQYHGDDACAVFFTEAIRRCAVQLPRTAAVLDIGCNEFNWLGHAHASWPSMTLEGLDYRPMTPRPYAVMTQADVMTHARPAASLDWVVLISALEHIGLGYYGDPIREDGDSLTMRQVYRWLKPGGWVYADVPIAEQHTLLPGHHPQAFARAYSKASIMARLHQGLGWRSGGRYVATLAGSKPWRCMGVWWQKP